jgi:4-amino-4-deoxy-L-arabinose transferase-like glycosyltransferase
LIAAAAFRLVRLNSLPPGLFQDEAVYGVNARTILDGVAQIYYGEREPFFEYQTALVMAILGPNVLALRISAALSGLFAVASGGALVRQLFGRRVGLVAAAGMAASLWLVTISRVGFRAITFPAVGGLGLALLWRATKTNRWRDYALAGLVLGLSLSTPTLPPDSCRSL